MQIAELIEKTSHLVSLPEAVMRANELIDDVNAGSKEIGDVISLDPNLSATLLKLANSAFYSFPSKIDSIAQAITLIGTRELRSLIVASSAVSAFQGVNSTLIDMNTFWQRAVYCGLVGKKIASRGRGKGESQFLCGLLHDVGKLILLMEMPRESNMVYQLRAEGGNMIRDLELEWFGFSSAELGGALLKSWRLPSRIWEPVKYQHNPEASREFFDEAHTLQLALDITDTVAPEVKTATDECGRFENFVNPAADVLDISLDDIENITAEVDMECLEVISIINPR